MLENHVSNRRATDSGFDIPMLQESVGGVSMYTFNLHIKVAAMKHNVPVPCLLVPRSSISGTPFRLANSIGLIDSGYRGEVKAKVDVLSNGVVENGSRLFQICSHDFMPEYMLVFRPKTMNRIRTIERRKVFRIALAVG